MKIYAVKLNAWTSPVYTQAMTQKRAKEKALQAYPNCDCCGAPTYVESVKEVKRAPFYTSVIMELQK